MRQIMLMTAVTFFLLGLVVGCSPVDSHMSPECEAMPTDEVCEYYDPNPDEEPLPAEIVPNPFR